MTSILHLLSTAVLLPIAVYPQIWAELDDGSLAGRSIIVQPSKLTLEYTRAAGKTLLKRKKGRQLAELRLFQSADAARFGLGKPGTEMTYGRWLRLYADDPNRLGPFGRVLVIGPNAVLLYVGAEGTRTEVITGQNALEHTIPNGSIVDLRLVPCATPECQDADQKILPIFFVCTTLPLTAELGKRITEGLRRLAGVDLVSVRVRNDHWFISDLWFPTTPAGVSDRPPTESMLKGAQERTCESRPATTSDCVPQLR